MNDNLQGDRRRCDVVDGKSSVIKSAICILHMLRQHTSYNQYTFPIIK